MVKITISGSPGSGKTTVAKILAKKLGLKYVYSGMIFRKMADKHQMTLEEFSKYCEKNDKIDRELDDHQLKILKKGDVVVEGRIAGWIAHRNNIPALKVILEADIETRSKRIVNREQGDVKKRIKEIIARERSEIFRYKNYYDIDLKDTSIYDVVIDSSDKTPDEIVEIIIKKVEK